MAELNEVQKAELDAHRAKQNRAYVREHSDSLEELRESEATLAEQGFDPGTGLPR